MSTKQKAVRFDRVSSAEQRDGFSLEAQKNSGEEMARKHNLHVVRSWSVDESASKEGKRKEFFEMLDYVKEKKIKAVIFDKVDRACRGLKSAVLIEECMNDYGVSFYFSRDNLVINQHSTPQEKMQFNLALMLARYYVDNLKSEIRKGTDAKIKAGIWSGKAPFGYKNIVVNGKRVVGVHDPEFKVGQEVFEMYATNNFSLDYLAAYIAKKVPERKKVTKRLVENMLENPFYYGMMAIKNELHEGTHVAMITKELFDKCKKIRGIRAAQSKSKSKGIIQKPFMGIFRCGECDHQVTGESIKKKSSGKVHIYYRCANHKCPEYKNRINQPDLLKLVAEVFEPFKRWTPKASQAFIETLKGSLEDLELYTQKMTGELAVARIELKKRVETLRQMKEDGQLTEPEFDAAVNTALKLLENNTEEIKAYQDADLTTFNRGCEIIQLFQKLYEFMSLEGNELDKARIVKMFLSNPKAKDRSLSFSYVKPFDVLLEHSKGHVWWRWRELNPRPQVIHCQALHS